MPISPVGHSALHSCVEGRHRPEQEKGPRERGGRDHETGAGGSRGGGGARGVIEKRVGGGGRVLTCRGQGSMSMTARRKEAQVPQPKNLTQSPPSAHVQSLS